MLLQLLLALPLLLIGYIAEPRRMKSDFAHSLLWIAAVVIATALLNLGLFFLFDLVDADPLSMAAGSNWLLGAVLGGVVLAASLILLGVRRIKGAIR